MKIKDLKVIMSAAFGLTLMVAAPTAMAWTSGSCPSGGYPAPNDDKPCFEYDGYYLTATGNDNTFLGDVNGDPFVFSGRTQLTCGSTNLDCDLELEGKLARNSDGSGGWLVNLEVSGADVSALPDGAGTPFLCSVVGVGGFDWHVAPTSEHANFTSSGGVPYPFVGGNLVGNVGGAPGTSGIDVSAGFTLVDNAHVHDVVYDNPNSTFQFNSTLYEDVTDADTGCTVNGDLSVQSVGSVHVY